MTVPAGAAASASATPPGPASGPSGPAAATEASVAPSTSTSEVAARPVTGGDASRPRRRAGERARGVRGRGGGQVAGRDGPVEGARGERVGEQQRDHQPGERQLHLGVAAPRGPRPPAAATRIRRWASGSARATAIRSHATTGADSSAVSAHVPWTSFGR